MKRISIIVGSLGIVSLLSIGTANALIGSKPLQPAAQIQTTSNGSLLFPAANTVQLTANGFALQPAANL